MICCVNEIETAIWMTAILMYQYRLSNKLTTMVQTTAQNHQHLKSSTLRSFPYQALGLQAKTATTMSLRRTRRSRMVELFTPNCKTSPPDNPERKQTIMHTEFFVRSATLMPTGLMFYCIDVSFFLVICSAISSSFLCRLPCNFST